MSIPKAIIVGAKVEVTHHMTFNAMWFSATVVRVTPCFIDVRRDDWPGSKPVRYRRSTSTEVTGYCGFFSKVRMSDDQEPTERSCRHGTRPIDDPCEVCDAE